MFSPAATETLALCVLGVLGAALVATVVWRAWRRNFALPQYLLLLFGRVMARVLWRGHVEGKIDIPPGQGAIIVCNHRSPFDPAFIQLATDRVVHWMVAKEYCEHPVLAWFFRILQAIPVGRGGIDTGATMLAIRYAHRGDMVGMLPEGRINTTNRLLLPGRPGVALVALRARVPVVPCYVSGSPYGTTVLGSLLLPAKARLIVGRPIDISAYYGREKEREVLEELTKKFLQEIARLAGVANYKTQLAGRHWKPED